MSLPIPGRPTDVTTAWLSAALSAGGEPVQVTDVDVVPVGTGQTGATYRIAATYAANPAGLPDTFVIKLPVQDDAVKGGVTLGYLSEVAFYARVADKMAVPTPRCFYSDIANEGADFALLLEDMSPAVQGDQIVGATAEQAQLAVTGAGRTARAELVRPDVAGPRRGSDAQARRRAGDQRAG